MRPIIAFNRMTADGYFAAPDGNLDWTVPEDEVDAAAANSLPGAGTILFGRKTYEMFESFWPKVTMDSPVAPDPHAKGRVSPALLKMGIWINEATKLVFSKTRKEVTWNNSRLLGDFDPRVIESIKAQPGKAIMIFGSGTITSLLTEHGLIDEYHFIVSPVLLGNGRNLLREVRSKTRLELVESKAHPSGNLSLRYTRARA